MRGPVIVTLLLIAGLLALGAQARTDLQAQSRSYIDLKNPPPGVDLNAAKPGDPAPDRPGETLQHDGKGWYYAVSGTQTPDAKAAGCPQPFNPYGMSDEVLARCFARPALTNPWTGQPFSFEIGEVYRDAYGARAIVIGIATDLTSPRRIITVRVIRSSHAAEVGALRAVYEDVATWWPLKPGEST